METSDIFALARRHIGTATYRRYVEMREAPHVVNCITFVRWLYCNHGVVLPPDYLSWLGLGSPVEQTSLGPYDLVFTDGYRNEIVAGVGEIGHVGIVTDRGMIIHATSKVGIEELPLETFFRKRRFCSARRIIG